MAQAKHRLEDFPPFRTPLAARAPRGAQPPLRVGQPLPSLARRAGGARPSIMIATKLVAVAVMAFTIAVSFAGKVRLSAPLDYQVIQRTTAAQGEITLTGEHDAEAPAGIEARIVTAKQVGEWQRLAATWEGEKFSATLSGPAGGWHRLEVREAGAGEEPVVVGHLGIGEVFVVAGQSNSANHGEEQQVARSGMVAAWDGVGKWQLASDPQPGASGGGGSFMPPFGDAIAQRFGVPVGLVACGIGASSVREWLPQGVEFPQPPTVEARVRHLDNGAWVADGKAYAALVRRMQALGPRGFRAVLWHQGESDANQKDPTRTLPGKLYAEFLTHLLRASRRDIAWDAPWFVAQVSYHVPGDEGSADIRGAQASLWRPGLALEGPDSDALGREFREAGGAGVHFSGAGLRLHAARWVERVAPWLEAELAAGR